MHNMSIMQGDSYPLVFNIHQGELTIDDSAVDDVEIAVGDVIKTFKNGEVYYSDGKWYFPLTQEETIKMSDFKKSVKVRVKFTDNSVIGATAKDICVDESTSKEVL